jgi:hypothetical protein
MTEYCKNKGCRFTREFCGCPEFYTGLTTKEKLAVAVKTLEDIVHCSSDEDAICEATDTLKEIQE